MSSNITNMDGHSDFQVNFGAIINRVIQLDFTHF